MKGFTGHEVATTVCAQTPSVTYHQTRVAETFGPEPRPWDHTHVRLRTGGWRTVTTKRRMNQAAEHWGLGYRVYQHRGEWFIRFFAADDLREDLPFTGSFIEFEAPPVHWNAERGEWRIGKQAEVSHA